ncbi:MAG: hypothetical protein HQ546_04285 [Planctomycetes bacterium]|nr:hypothetical protein [Planctomycetota bacterium]
MIPDADTKGVPVVLDLASGKMLDAPAEGVNEPFFYFTDLGKGDVGFDRLIFILRGGKLATPDGRVLESKEVKADASAYDLATLPAEAVVKTGDGTAFKLRVVSVTSDGGLRIRYAPATQSGQQPMSGSAETKP